MTPTNAPVTTSKASELDNILNLLLAAGTATAAIAVKNAAHVATLSNIMASVQALLPALEALL